jgi:hypothetical protein
MGRCCLLFLGTRSAPRNSTRFAAQYLAHGLPCERFTAALASRTSCITRGRGGWLDLPRGGLAPPILCQLPGALRDGSFAADRCAPKIAPCPMIRCSQRDYICHFRHMYAACTTCKCAIWATLFLTPYPSFAKVRARDLRLRFTTGRGGTVPFTTIEPSAIYPFSLFFRRLDRMTILFRVPNRTVQVYHPTRTHRDRSLT